MTSSDPLTRMLVDPSEPVRPQWWPNALLVRSGSVEQAPFRPSAWSGRQSAEFQSLRVRSERSSPLALAADAVGDVPHPTQADVPDAASDTVRNAAQAQAPAPARMHAEARAENEAGPHNTPTAHPATTTDASAPTRAAAGRATPAEAPAAQALQDAYARGVADGQARSRTRDEAARQRQETLLNQLQDRLDHGGVRTADWSTPIKRLCLRLAEEIVRGELQQPRTVERLVEQGLAALGDSSKRPVVRLHPEDLAVLAPLLPRFGERCRFEGVPGMSRGSVEVAADDMLMQDLIENRLRALADQLFQEDAEDPPGAASEA